MICRIKRLIEWVWEYITLTPKKYDEVIHKLECLLWHATGGMYSKAGYALSDMYDMVNDYVDRCCEVTVESEIVRCKDCKHYMTIHCTCDGCCISDDWYCADGERKDNVQ